MPEKVCKRCLNSTANPAIKVADICDVCFRFKTSFDPSSLIFERKWVEDMKSTKKQVMVGVSGGKDSTATLDLVKQMGFDPLAFTFDIGYYPKHIFPRAKKVAEKQNVFHEIIDIRPHIRKLDVHCYRLTADLFNSFDVPEHFREIYRTNREHYSAKSNGVMPFVRACQLCRRTVIRAYYAEAVKRDISLVFLGMNEWAGLSGNVYKAVRKLQPFLDQPPVYVVHLPFLLQRDIASTFETLRALGWIAPEDELLVESNANSCLFAKATEEKAKAMLGFHPDTTRLSREVTVGFITRDLAQIALSRPHVSDKSVSQVLVDAGIL